MTDASLQDWVGRVETLTDRLDTRAARALAATFDQPFADIADGSAVPALWSWLAFLPLSAMADVGPDGHPKRGGFLPPVDLPRRMWAGSRITIHRDLILGQPITRTSTIAKIAEKDGKAGRMVFVTVRHETAGAYGPLMEEEQDIVYLPMPERFSPPEPVAAPTPPDWTEPRPFDPVLLFRFSALTFNGHRIHYDRDYATAVEKYPGLVVHGPLQALLLHEAGRARANRPVAGFAFRGVRPLFDFDAATLNGRAREDGGLDLYTAQDDGYVCMTATMRFREPG
jgi:3-methylfumaryl-CoA hydratase